MKTKSMGMWDGIKSLTNSLINKRDTSNTNFVTSRRMQDLEMLAIYKSGIGSKIYRLKSGHALNKTIEFQTKEDEDFYTKKLSSDFKRATKYMLGFGRGLIVIVQPGQDLSQPMTGAFDRETAFLHVFDGGMTKPLEVDLDLMSPRYNQPITYSARGAVIHYSRVVDLTYYETTELDLPNYFYAGVSEAELIRDQLVNDGIVQRAAPQILEKNSTIFYKLKGFRELIEAKKESVVLDYFGTLETARSIYGAGILDGEDEIESITQALTNLSEVDQITLRRLAMVTGIPLPYLIGENVQGLNSSGDTERLALQDTINNLQSEYLLDPINRLAMLFGLGTLSFKEDQGITPVDKANVDKTITETAKMLMEIGFDEDAKEYLIENGVIIKKDAVDLAFPEEPEPTQEDVDNAADQAGIEIQSMFEGINNGE